MPPEIPIETLRLRLLRAKRRIEEFHREAGDYISASPYHVVGKKEREGDQEVLVLRLKLVKPLPEELRFTFGEAIHHLRALCDNVVVALAERHGVKAGNNLNFPVKFVLAASKPGDGSFESWRKQFRFPDPILDHLESLQPFNTLRAPNGNTFSGKGHPFFILNRLWNEDKHKQPLTLHALHRSVGVEHGGLTVTSTAENCQATATGGWSVKLKGSDEFIPLNEIVAHSGHEVEDGSELARLAVAPGQPIGDVKTPLRMAITIDKRFEAAPHADAQNLLIYLHDVVRIEVLDKLAPFLE